MGTQRHPRAMGNSGARATQALQPRSQSPPTRHHSPNAISAATGISCEKRRRISCPLSKRKFKSRRAVGTKRARGGSSQFEQDAAIDLSPHDREPILAESPDSHREFKMCKIDGANPLTPASEGPNGRPLLDKDVMMQSSDYVGYNKCLDGQQTPELPRPLSITDQILDAASKVDEGVGAEDFCKYATKYDGGEVEPSSPYNGAANAQSCSTTDAVVSPGALSPQAPSTLPRSRVADHGVPKCGHLMGTLEGANGDYSVHPDQLGKGNFGTVSTYSVNSLKLYGSMSIATEPCGVQVCRGNVVSSGRAVAVK